MASARDEGKRLNRRQENLRRKRKVIATGKKHAICSRTREATGKPRSEKKIRACGASSSTHNERIGAGRK